MFTLFFLYLCSLYFFCIYVSSILSLIYFYSTLSLSVSIYSFFIYLFSILTLSISSLFFLIYICLLNSYFIYVFPILSLSMSSQFLLYLCFLYSLFIYVCSILALSIFFTLFYRYIHEEWLLGETMCRLYPFFFYGNVRIKFVWHTKSIQV